MCVILHELPHIASVAFVIGILTSLLVKLSAYQEEGHTAYTVSTSVSLGICTAMDDVLEPQLGSNS